MPDGLRRQFDDRSRCDVGSARRWVGPDIRKAMPDKSIDWLTSRPSARLEARRIGPAWLLEVAASPMRIAGAGEAKGARMHRAGVRGACFHLVVHRTGRTIYGDGTGDEIVLGAGAVALIDGARPCAACHPEGLRLTVWSLPRATVGSGLPDLPAAAPVGGEAASLLAAQARLVAARAGRLPATLQRTLVDHLCHLVALAFTNRDMPRAVHRAGRAAHRRTRVRTYLETRFRDPGLCVERAAEDLGMSRRWLQTHFPEGSGFAAALAERRLEASLAMLRDPAARHLTVTEIAFASGFNDLSTFHRRFRSRYGLSPRAARGAQMDRCRRSMK